VESTSPGHGEWGCRAVRDAVRARAVLPVCLQFSTPVRTLVPHHKCVSNKRRGGMAGDGRMRECGIRPAAGTRHENERGLPYERFAVRDAAKRRHVVPRNVVHRNVVSRNVVHRNVVPCDELERCRLHKGVLYDGRCIGRTNTAGSHK